jgi:hypothetical protein
VNSATQIVVSTTSTAAQASAGCIVIGQVQDTAMASISTAVAANTVICPVVDLPSGVFLISSVPTFMASQPTDVQKTDWWKGKSLAALVAISSAVKVPTLRLFEFTRAWFLPGAPAAKATPAL